MLQFFIRHKWFVWLNGAKTRRHRVPYSLGGEEEHGAGSGQAVIRLGLTFADPITLDPRGQQLFFRMIAESFTFISDPLLILTGPGQKKAPWGPPGRGRAGDTERTVSV